MMTIGVRGGLKIVLERAGYPQAECCLNREGLNTWLAWAGVVLVSDKKTLFAI
jgi:hypothetical protein